tara:strand:+ start:67 stop:912 length:846 start_codon:yes stop_codon:yes gene_type:complete
MKISVIQNVWKRNPYIAETIEYNLLALEEAGVDYQYIIFNDKGDKEIYEDVQSVIEDNPNVLYHYSDVNFGDGKCTGGWLGAVPLLEGDIVHNTGQDDVFVADFYRRAVLAFEDGDVMFFTCNGYQVNEKLENHKPILDPRARLDYNNPHARFREWFGISDQGIDPWFQTSIPKNEVTRANNMISAPGTLYRKSLHDIIGTPSPDEFYGTCDFEYWARILFYKNRGLYDPKPLWLYRVSEYSHHQEATSDKFEVTEDHRPPYMEKIKQKYKKLWEKEVMQL